MRTYGGEPIEALMIAVAGLLVVAAAAALAPRLRIAAPIILVVLGIAISLLPFVPPLHVSSELILAGILPPLLYSASVQMPAMNFRREFNAIGGLSVALVVISSIVLGFFFAWVIPGLSIWWGIALGAIVSPTDAVATSIVKRVGIRGRVVAVLEGESLLNDATALVLLRTAVAATAAAISFWGVLGSFLYAVVIAVILGFVVGHLNLWVRSKVPDATVNTVISFTVPFLASIPAELLGASGLVAAVVAGLVTGHGAARRLPPQHRLSDSQNWRAVELVFEGAIFLLMGLELFGIINEVQYRNDGLGPALVVAVGAFVLTLLVRAAYVAALLAGVGRRARRSELVKPQLDVMQQRLDSPDPPSGRPGSQRPAPGPEQLERAKTHTRRVIADIDYLLATPLGWREGGVLVWAGMRGAVTVAAAQTLPPETPDRAFLILVAFVVAAMSLLIQGGTLSVVVGWLKPAAPDEQAELEERGRLLAMLTTIERDIRAASAPVVELPTDTAADAALPTPESFAALKALTIHIIEAQRTALLDARDDGTFSAEILNHALDNLDADQISIELKGAPADQ
ncbi:cation:proton antiporter [Diaminobutyricibacter sp. McL0608]|uniref:cation:proton antiporter n=1 Tax=Leifsonia sp. McL0608 TaxID=3143537 RepID=UPI0031F335B1